MRESKRRELFQDYISSLDTIVSPFILVSQAVILVILFLKICSMAAEWKDKIIGSQN